MILALLLAAAPIGAQSINSPGGRALFEPLKGALAGAKVGQWATFKIDGGGDRVQYWRLAVVGEETDKKGRPAFWLELELGQHPAMKAPLLQLRMLIARDVGMTKDGVTRLFVAVGADRPNEVTDDAMERLVTPEPVKVAAPANNDLGGLSPFTGQPTRLVTLAGTVTATPVELRLRSSVVKRVWVSEAIPLLHVAKLEIPGISHTIEVRDFGIDARPQMVLPAAGTPKIKVEKYEDVAIDGPPEP